MIKLELNKFVEFAAINKMLKSIGPTQGAHPIAKKIPKRKFPI